MISSLYAQGKRGFERRSDLQERRANERWRLTLSRWRLTAPRWRPTVPGGWSPGGPAQKRLLAPPEFAFPLDPSQSR